MMPQYVKLAKSYNEAKPERGNMGVWVWMRGSRRSMLVHKKENGFLIVSNNVPFLEVFEDHFVIIAPPNDFLIQTNRMNLIMDSVMPTGKKGDRYRFYIGRRMNDRLNMRVCYYNSNQGKFIDHCIVDSKGEMIYTDFDKIEVEKETEKITAFRKQLRNYFKPYEVLLRLQSVEAEIKRLCERKWNNNLEDMCRRLGIVRASDGRAHGNLVPDQIIKHIADGGQMNIELTTLIVIVMNAYIHHYYGHESFLGKVRLAKKILRLRFTQGCTKVMYDKYIPEEAYAKHQSMVIQQINGLRSLQVPSPTQVSGQGAGAVQAAA